MKKPTMPRLTYDEVILYCPYCGCEVRGNDLQFSTSIRKVTTFFHYKCMIRRNHEILQYKEN